MAKLSAPYNFVPISKHVYTVDYGDKISMDAPFKDGEDGIIELEIKNLTPLFIGGKKEKDQDQVLESRHVQIDGTKHYYIPGTTLKGCFRSVMEVISFAKMQQFNNDSFGWRDVGKKTKKDCKSANGCGWLQKEGNNYYLTPCKGGVQRIRHDDIRDQLGFGNFNPGEDHKTAEIKIKSLKTKDNFPTVTIKSDSCYEIVNEKKKFVPEGKYQLVCTGYMNEKKVEYLFSEDQGKRIEIDETFFKKFDTVHRNTEFYGGSNNKGGFLRPLLMKGDPIPVFFYKVYKEKNEEIKEIGITANFRNAYKYSVQDCVKRVQKDFDKVELDLPEAIFGHIKENKSLRGRVLIGNAFCENTNVKPDDEPVVGVLGQPRASFYPLYLEQKEGRSLVNYDSDKAKIAGRKRYRIPKSLKTLALSQGNDNEKVKTRFHPLPNGLTFKCRISIHNLRKVEIGALLSSITFNKTQNTYHNIGIAKSFGYGVVTCKVAGLKYLNHSVDEYIAAFNEEMSAFLQMNDSGLSKETALEALVSIASDTHTHEEMRMMSLEEYEHFKGETCVAVLQEKEKQYHIPIDETKAIKEKYFREWNEKVEDGDLYGAKEKLEELKMTLINDKKDVSEVAEKIDELSKQIKEKDANELAEKQKSDFDRYIKEAKEYIENREWEKAKNCIDSAKNIFPDDPKVAETQEQLDNARKEAADLKSDLDKVKNIRGIREKVRDWLIKTENTNLPDAERQHLFEALKRLGNSKLDRNEKRDFKNNRSSLWEKITTWTDEETAQEWFNKLNS